MVRYAIIAASLLARVTGNSNEHIRWCLISEIIAIITRFFNDSLVRAGSQSLRGDVLSRIHSLLTVTMGGLSPIKVKYVMIVMISKYIDNKRNIETINT
jgi:hypothetical protein